jgi:hypothetical protein
MLQVNCISFQVPSPYFVMRRPRQSPNQRRENLFPQPKLPSFHRRFACLQRYYRPSSRGSNSVLYILQCPENA